MKLHQLIIILIALGADVGLSVTINTPPHSQRTVLGHYFHLPYGTVTGLAFYPSHFDVLRVVKIRQVTKFVYPYPLNGCIRIDRIVNFGNLWRYTFLSIHVVDIGMAVHTDIC